MNKKNWPDQIRQHVRSLCGVMLFLLMLKSATVLRVFRVMATFAALVAGSLSRLFWLMVNLNRHKTWDIYGIYTVRSISVEYIRRIFELGLLWYVARQKGSTLRFQVLSWWWRCPVWGTSCSAKGPTTSAHFSAPSDLCCVIGGLGGLRASTPPGVFSSFQDFTCPRL